MILVDLLFPKRCAGCKRWGSYFCESCQANILQSDLVCPICERASIGGATHPLCRRRYGLDGLWSLGVYNAPQSGRLHRGAIYSQSEYQDPLKGGIQKLKYRFVSDLASTLVNLLITYWARYSPQFFEEIKKDPQNWIVVPVPLHIKRERWRGFNQAGLLGQMIALKLGLNYSPILKRTKYTTPQVGLKGKLRYQNVKGAFTLNSKFMIHNSNILLIDDVWTTGSTLKECGSVLKRAGVKKVWAITLAR
jgi:ComF family protein